MNRLKERPRLSLPKRPRKSGDGRATGYRGYRGSGRSLAWWGWLSIGGLCLGLMVLEWQLCLHFPAVSSLCRALATGLARIPATIFGIVPFPICEWLLVGLVMGWMVCLARHVLRRRWKALARALCRLFAMLCAMAFLFVLLYGAHHTGPSLASRLGLTVEQYSADQLTDLYALLVDKVNEYAPQVTRDSDGKCDFGRFSDLNRPVLDAYYALSEKYAFYDRKPAGTVKRSLIGGRVMSYVDYAGFYCPWTAESVVSSDVVDSHIPFNIAHELAHGMGIGPEAECNFSAWLACTSSDNVNVRYSGWLCAFVYANNALAGVDRDAWMEHYARLNDQARLDLQVLSESLARFEGTAINKLGSQANDALIKATGQPEGLRSYGKMVDLMLAYYATSAE